MKTKHSLTSDRNYSNVRGLHNIGIFQNQKLDVITKINSGYRIKYVRKLNNYKKKKILSNSNNNIFFSNAVLLVY